MSAPNFMSDYMEGAHPKILEALLATNEEKSATYGADEYSERAREKIREKIENPNARVYFLVGGTQTNATVLASILSNYEGVISADTGHIATHEAGAVEARGHKVLTIPAKNGKISLSALDLYLSDFFADETYLHMVKPGAVYISQPTEYGTLYTKDELQSISEISHGYGLKLYIDGARLGYALAADASVTLADIARVADVFYIGGTKCGALFGEAVVFTNPDIAPQFFTTIKQSGALLAKGRIAGIQFDTLFTDDLYTEICKNAVTEAMYIKDTLTARGYKFHIDSPTNQQFLIVDEEKYDALKCADIGFNTWERLPSGDYVIRLVTSFMTKRRDTEELLTYFE